MYSVSATIGFENHASYAFSSNYRNIYCAFTGDGLSYIITLPGSFAYVTTTLQTIVNVANGVDVNCHGLGINQDQVFAGNRRMVAIPIEGVVHNQ